MDTVHFFPNTFSEEGKSSLTVTILEATNSVFNKTDENNRFSFTTPGYSSRSRSEETIQRLNKLQELRSQKYNELHEKQVWKSEIKSARYNGFEDMVCRMQLTFSEIIDILDIKIIYSIGRSYTLPPGKYENSDLNCMLETLIPSQVMQILQLMILNQDPI